VKELPAPGAALQAAVWWPACLGYVCSLLYVGYFWIGARLPMGTEASVAQGRFPGPVARGTLEEHVPATHCLQVSFRTPTDCSPRKVVFKSKEGRLQVQGRRGAAEAGCLRIDLQAFSCCWHCCQVVFKSKEGAELLRLAVYVLTCRRSPAVGTAAMSSSSPRKARSC